MQQKERRLSRLSQLGFGKVEKMEKMDNHTKSQLDSFTKRYKDALSLSEEYGGSALPGQPLEVCLGK